MGSRGGVGGTVVSDVGGCGTSPTRFGFGAADQEAEDADADASAADADAGGNNADPADGAGGQGLKAYKGAA